jgi:cytochrome P450
MWTQNAEVIHQLTSRREDFPKPVEIYDILSIYGLSVLTTEGATWRLHRKVTSASFNEKNAAHTFGEAIYQSQGMIDKWVRGPPTIRTLEHDTMTLALNIIAYVGFGMRCFWEGQALPDNLDPKQRRFASMEPPAGYTLTFADSIATVLRRIIPLVLAPRWFLRTFPAQWAREAYAGDANFTKYMDEFLADKIADVRAGTDRERGMDIMGALVRSKYGAGSAGKSEASTLSDANIIGNAFIMLLAGHETTANTLHFAFIELATNPAAQRALQADVDRIFGGADPATWDYEQSINVMLASHIGAAMNEALRMYPAVVEIPKKVAGASQVITRDGEKHVLTAPISLTLAGVSVQRNPRYWPTRPSKLTGERDDLNDFLPSRWFRNNSGEEHDSGKAEEDTEDYGGFQGRDTSDALFRPPRGSFIPFSDGARSCLGRRIAQVEMLAALAVVFQKHSVELAVDDFATDAEVAAMGRVQRAKVYQQAQARSRETLRGAESVITLKLHGGQHIPIRLVKRGEERFVGFMDP